MSNYRPLFLLSVPSKILESCVADMIAKHVFSENEARHWQPMGLPRREIDRAITHPLESVSFHQSYPSFVGIYAFHGQHKPPSPAQQRIFLLIFIATIREIFCLSPLLVMRIWCHFFPSWIPFDHSNFSLSLQPHSIIKPNWSDSAPRPEVRLYSI